MKTLMDEVRFEERWSCRSYAKERRPAAAKDAQRNCCEYGFRFRIESDIESIYKREDSCLLLSSQPLEKLSQETLPTGDSWVLVIFGASGDLTNGS